MLACYCFQVSTWELVAVFSLLPKRNLDSWIMGESFRCVDLVRNLFIQLLPHRMQGAFKQWEYMSLSLLDWRRAKEWSGNQTQNLTRSRNRAWLAGVPGELCLGVRQSRWLYLTRQAMGHLQNRTQKLSSLLWRRKMNSPPAPELASFPQA